MGLGSIPTRERSRRVERERIGRGVLGEERGWALSAERLALREGEGGRWRPSAFRFRR